VYDVVVKKFTFAISSPDEFRVLIIEASVLFNSVHSVMQLFDHLRNIQV